MFYVYKSPTGNNFIHVTTDKELYSEGYLLKTFSTATECDEYALLEKKEICWCDYNPIPHSLS